MIKTDYRSRFSPYILVTVVKQRIISCNFVSFVDKSVVESTSRILEIVNRSESGDVDLLCIFG